MSHQTIRFTEIQAVRPETIAKKYHRYADGTVTKHNGGEVVAGVATVHEMTMHALCKYVENIVPDTALVYGVPEHSLAYLLSKEGHKQWTPKAGDNTPIIERSKNHFFWSRGGGILMLDYDPPKHKDTAYTYDELRAEVFQQIPEFVAAPHIGVSTSSSYIYHPDGTLYQGERGWRLLVGIADGHMAPELLRRVEKRMWLAGHGYVHCTVNGNRKLYNLMDMMTAQANRLDFIAGAHCTGGLVQRRQVHAYNLDAPLLTMRQYPTISREEHNEVRRLMALELHRKETESNRIRSIWSDARAERDVQHLPVQDRPAAKAKLRKMYERTAREGGIIGGEFRLYIHLPEEKRGWVTAREIMRNRAYYHGCQGPDPMDPEYDNDMRVAMYYTDQRAPRIYSHQHGGMQYRLSEEAPDTDTLEEARERIKQHLLHDDIDNKVILVTPGSGKTFAGIEDAVRKAVEGAELIVYAVATQKLAKDAAKDAQKLVNHGVPSIVQYCGRFHSNKLGNTWEKYGEAKNCNERMYPIVEDAARRGYSIMKAVCLSCNYHPRNAKTRGRTGCRYMRQLDWMLKPDASEAVVMFTSSRCLPSLLEELSEHHGKKVRYVYIDEQATDAMISSIEPLTSDALKTTYSVVNKEAKEVVDKLIELSDSAVEIVQESGERENKYYVKPQGNELSIISPLEMTTEEMTVLSTEITRLIDPKSTDWREGYKNGVNWAAVKWLETFCGMGNTERQAWLHVNKSDTTGHAKWHLAEIRRLPEDIKITALDATGSVGEMEKLFGRAFNVLHARVEFRMDTVWVRRKITKKTAMKLTDVQIQAHIEMDFGPRIRSTDKVGFVATIEILEKRVLKILKKLYPQIEWRSAHYWGARGLNIYKECTIGLLYGFSYQNVSSLEDNARLLWGSDLLTRDAWSRGINVREVSQIAHRMRPVLEDGKLLVIIGDIFPDDLGTPEIIDRTNDVEHSVVNQALDVALTRIDSAGYYSRRLMWMNGVCRDSELDRATRLREYSDFRKKIESENDVDPQCVPVPKRVDGICVLISHPHSLFADSDEPRRNDWIISADDHFWVELEKEILARRPGLQKLEVRDPEIDPRNRTFALGDIAKAEEMDKVMHEVLGLKPGIWRYRKQS